MQLFHYHYWTPFVEETEQTCTTLGFVVLGWFIFSFSVHRG